MRWVIACALALAACSVKTGPFIPDHPQRCSCDVDCPRGTVCRFPSRDYGQAVCTPGENPLD